MKRFLNAISIAHGGFNCTDDDLSSWLDEKEIAALKKATVLIIEKAATPIICPACGSHRIMPVFSGMANGNRSYYAVCDDPAIGTFDLNENFNYYKVDLPKLAKVIAAGLNLNDDTHELVPGQLYMLGKKTTVRGSVRCWLLLSDDIMKYNKFLEESSKTAPTVVLYGHTPPISFINSIAVINTNEILKFQQGKLKIDATSLDHVTAHLMGTNYYEGRTLYARGDAIASFKKGTKLDIILTYITDTKHIDKTIPYTDILKHYNEEKSTKHTGAAQWCYQALTDLRNACPKDKRHLVDIIIKKSGKENQENSLIFKAKT